MSQATRWGPQQHVSRRGMACNSLGRTPKGSYCRGGILGTFWKPPSQNPSQNPFFTVKPIRRSPSQNPSENPSPEPCPRTFSEPFFERCVAVRPRRRAPNCCPPVFPLKLWQAMIFLGFQKEKRRQIRRPPPVFRYVAMRF